MRDVYAIAQYRNKRGGGRREERAWIINPYAAWRYARRAARVYGFNFAPVTQDYHGYINRDRVIAKIGSDRRDGRVFPYTIPGEDPRAGKDTTGKKIMLHT